MRNSGKLPRTRRRRRKKQCFATEERRRIGEEKINKQL
jgi:hypothetical protein